MNLFDQATDLGAEIVFEKAVAIQESSSAAGVLGEADLQGQDMRFAKTVVTDKNRYQCRAVILATGAKNRPLGIEGEEKLIGSGLSYCATCDGAFFRGKDVAVVGGGNTALEDAMFLSEYCSKVYVIHRRDEFRGEDYLHGQLAKRGNVEFVLDSVVESIDHEDSIKGIVVKNTKTSEIRSSM